METVYTDRMKTALRFAREIAITHGNDYVSVEHMLSSLLSDEDGPAINALKALGVPLDQLNEAVTELLNNYRKTENFTLGQMMPFTPRLKKALEVSLFVARSTASKYAGTDHLLMALVKDDQDSPLWPIFSRFGITYEKLEKKIPGPLSEPTESVIRNSDGQYEWECWRCGDTNHLTMIPHRNKGERIVGLIASCPNCLQSLIGGSIRITAKDKGD